MNPSPSKAAPLQGRLDALAALFAEAGWSADPEPTGRPGAPDLLVGRGPLLYAVEAKVAEGRADRVLPLLSQAVLQARQHAARHGAQPLAVVLVGHLSPSLQRKVIDFRNDYLADAPIGVFSEHDGSLFIGPGLDGLGQAAPRARARGASARPRKDSDLFSDLNQWLLKVLLAPELPEALLNAPRRTYATGAELAQAAGVSPMSVSRFLRRLQEEAFLDQASGELVLVRREELFRRWQSAAMRSSPELRLSFLMPPGSPRQLHALANQLDACVGLFSAAELLGVGHVSGAIPHLYVRRLSPPGGAAWPGLVPSAPGERPHVILKQSRAPESLFRAAVRVGDVRVSDVVQVWLDVSAHPSRGAEQAEVLRRGVLSGVMGRGP